MRLELTDYEWADTWADTTTPHGRLMLTLLGGLAEFERSLIPRELVHLTTDIDSRATRCRSTGRASLHAQMFRSYQAALPWCCRPQDPAPFAQQR
jgi:hypothetical protein